MALMILPIYSLKIKIEHAIMKAANLNFYGGNNE